MTRSSDPWITPRPEGTRFTGAGKYWRPQWGIYRLWFPSDLWHAAQHAALTGVAAAASIALAGIRFWRGNNDETGD